MSIVWSHDMIYYYELLTAYNISRECLFVVTDLSLYHICPLVSHAQHKFMNIKGLFIG